MRPQSGTQHVVILNNKANRLHQYLHNYDITLLELSCNQYNNLLLDAFSF